MENDTLNLLSPPPQECLSAWLNQLYGKPVAVERRQLLRHRDFSFVERLYLPATVSPATLIYKVVLPPWDIEKDLYEKVLIPGVSRSARLYLTGSYQGQTALFVEDLGQQSLLDGLAGTGGLAEKVGTEVASMHSDFNKQLARLQGLNILRTVAPSDFALLAGEIAEALHNWKMVHPGQEKFLCSLGEVLSDRLADEPLSLVHGDLYAENLLFDGKNLFIIDWSWFAGISVAILDLASLSMDHFKNGELRLRRESLIKAYCRQYPRDSHEVYRNLPYAEMLNRLFFLEWLVERRRRGIMGTTVGPVENLIAHIIQDLTGRLAGVSGPDSGADSSL